MSENIIKEDKDRSVCPSCGYFAGTYHVCVRCGALIHRRTSVRVFRIIALWGSVLGILLLWYFAYKKQPEPVFISHITEVMNNAFVVLEGDVTGITMDEKKNSLRITINDGTGQIKINAFNRLDGFKEALGDDMPSLKDRIKVTGSLSISQAWGITMFLTVPERINIAEKYIVKDMHLSQLSKEYEGDIFNIEAEMIDYEEFTTRKGFTLHKFLLADGTAELPMVLYSSGMDSLPQEKADALKIPGSRLKMRASISVYRGNVQLNPCDISRSGDLIITSVVSERNEKYVKIAIGKLGSANAEKKYLIDEQVEAVSLGADGVYFDMQNSKYDIFMRYARWDRLAGKDMLESGRGILRVPVTVEKDLQDIRFRIADFSKISIREREVELQSSPASLSSPPEEETRSDTAKAQQPVIPEPPLADLDELDVSVIGPGHLGKHFIIHSAVDSMDLGIEGIYLDLAGTDIGFFMEYSLEEQIGDFSVFNEPGVFVSAAVKLASTAEGLQLRVAIPDSVKIEKK